jgi:hypothetical protein
MRAEDPDMPLSALLLLLTATLSWIDWLLPERDQFYESFSDRALAEGCGETYKNMSRYDY